MTAAIPENESSRLEALQKYRILDTPPERVFNDVAMIASTIAGTPIALMTLVDGNRQWFKANIGLSVSETPREQAFCAHTILGTLPMIVEDATKDPRFSQNPLVTSDPEIRFYAGAPLITHDGHALGSLCVIDKKPRTFDSRHRSALMALARIVTAQLEARLITFQLSEAMSELDGFNRFLTVCSHCKKIRDSKGTWQSLKFFVESKIGEQENTTLCPDCAALQPKSCVTTEYLNLFSRAPGLATGLPENQILPQRN